MQPCFTPGTHAMPVQSMLLNPFIHMYFFFGWRLDCDEIVLKDRFCLKHLQCGPLLVINEFVTSLKCLVNG